LWLASPRPASRGQRPRLHRILPVLLAAITISARAEVQIERTFLPDAHASSFAFGLPGGVNVCYDPVRGGVNYAWTGGFLDLTNVRPVNKLVKAAVLLGPVVYRETGSAPLRRGDVRRVPVVEFKGYTLHDASVELRYTVDGILVSEEIRANATGTALIRRFRVEGGTDARWWHVVDGQPATELKHEAGGTLVLEVPLGKAAP
jgi:hypothetical protein